MLSLDGDALNSGEQAGIVYQIMDCDSAQKEHHIIT